MGCAGLFADYNYLDLRGRAVSRHDWEEKNICFRFCDFHSGLNAVRFIQSDRNADRFSSFTRNSAQPSSWHLGSAIVTEAFPPSERGKALGIMGSVVSIGVIIGPTIGGILLEAISWHWLFFVNVPIGIIGVIMVMRFVPAIRPPGGERFDFLGAAVLFACLFSLLLGLSLSQDLGFGHLQVSGLLALSAVFLVLFIFLELRNHQPMIELRLFKNALLSVNLVTGFLVFIAGCRHQSDPAILSANYP